MPRSATSAGSRRSSTIHTLPQSTRPCVHRSQTSDGAPTFAATSLYLVQLRTYFEDKDSCEVKCAKEKTGAVSVALTSGRYFLNIDLTIPPKYPTKAAEIRKHESNLPRELQTLFLTSAADRARRLAELPTVVEDAGRAVAREGAGSGVQSKSEALSQMQSLATRRKVDTLASDAEASRHKASEKRRELEATFVSRPSLFPIVAYLYEQCLAPLASGKCLICNKLLLPSRASDDRRPVERRCRLQVILHGWRKYRRVCWCCGCTVATCITSDASRLTSASRLSARRVCTAARRSSTAD